MAQTQLDYNEIMFGTSDMKFRSGIRTIAAGNGELLAGTILVVDPATSKYNKWDSAAVAPITALGALAVTEDSVVDSVDFTGESVTTADVVATVANGTPTVGAVNTTPVVGLAILLEAIDATDEVTTAKLGFTGGIDKDKLVAAGSTITTITEYVMAVLRANNIFVRVGTNALSVAGE